MKFSIIVVTFNRKKTLASCLESIRAQTRNFPFEVIVILNGDLTYLDKYRSQFREFSFCHIPFTTMSGARNIASKKAKGEYLFFLDEDCILPKDYLENINFDLGWDVLGGPDQAPKSALPFQRLIARALASPLSMGPAYRRHSLKSSYNSEADEVSLIISNLWFKRSLFSEEGFHFNEKLFKNEAYYLLTELSQKKKKLHYNPRLCVYHQSTPDMEKLGAAFIQSGKYRGRSFLLNPRKKEIIYFSPILFLIVFFLMIFNPSTLFIGLLIIYSLAILTYDLIFHHRCSLRLVLVHYLIQLCYGIGLIQGLLVGIKEIYTNFKVNKSFISESRSK